MMWIVKAVEESNWKNHPCYSNWFFVQVLVVVEEAGFAAAYSKTFEVAATLEAGTVVAVVVVVQMVAVEMMFAN
jgi:hypothetical protein